MNSDLMIDLQRLGCRNNDPLQRLWLFYDVIDTERDHYVFGDVVYANTGDVELPRVYLDLIGCGENAQVDIDSACQNYEQMLNVTSNDIEMMSLKCCVSVKNSMWLIFDEDICTIASCVAYCPITLMQPTLYRH